MAKSQGTAGRDTGQAPPPATRGVQPISRQEIDARIEAITLPSGPQGRVLKPGEDERELRSLFRNMAVVDLASRFRYNDGTTGKEFVDRYVKQGARFEERKRGVGKVVTLTLPAGGEYTIRNSEPANYARLVYGKLEY